MSPLSDIRTRRAALAFILVTAVLDILSMGLVIPVLPGLIEQFAGSNAAAGVWNGVFAFFIAAATLLLAAVVGWIVARRAEREEAATV